MHRWEEFRNRSGGVDSLPFEIRWFEGKLWEKFIISSRTEERLSAFLEFINNFCVINFRVFIQKFVRSQWKHMFGRTRVFREADARTLRRRVLYSREPFPVFQYSFLSTLFLADIQSLSPVKLASRFMHLLLFPPKCVALPHLNTPTNTLHNRSFPRSPIVLPDNVPLMQASRTVWEQVGEKKRERESISIAVRERAESLLKTRTSWNESEDRAGRHMASERFLRELPPSRLMETTLYKGDSSRWFMRARKLRGSMSASKQDLWRAGGSARISCRTVTPFEGH